ncbi:tail fiber domain-containing protein [Flavobacterium sp. N2820]|uniref:tail fiber domain-containing protein n=1 Tax=Flavobacterium sp. N2820 TaxID=2986834 RepID=UPI002224D79A|nr:tail fiber domain-containing protein [Flavobacterium sp. N2820]
MKQILNLLFFLGCTSVFSQVGVNTTTPNAAFDVNSANQGVLVSRVALTSKTVAAPVVNPQGGALANGTLVFNTATAGTSPNNVVPGFYYWDTPTLRWIAIASDANTRGWSVNGNASTNPATDFVGTTDARDFTVRTNNLERMRVMSTGNVGIGTPTPAYKLDLANGTFGFGNSNSRTETRDNAGLQGNAGAQSGFYETVAPINFPAGASSWWHLIDSRHNNPANNYALQIAGSFADQDLYFRKTNNSPTTAWSKLLTSNSGWGTTGNAGTNPAANFIGTTDARDFVVRTANTERMRITASGNVGIATSTPWAPLQFDNSIQNRKIVMWQNFNNDHNFYGFGVNSYGLRYQVEVPTSNHIFYAGTSTTTSNELMRITGTGNVGIGVAAPAQRLDVQGGNARINNAFIGDVGHGGSWTGFAHYSQANPSGYGLLQASDGNYTFINKQNTGGGYLGFRIGNADQAVILNNGNMGVGTTNPSKKFTVVNGSIRPHVGNSSDAGISFPTDPGGGGGDEAFIRYYVDGGGENTKLLIGNNNDADDDISFFQGGAERMNIYAGNVGIGITTPWAALTMGGGAYCNSFTWVNASDARLKENIKPMNQYGLTQVLQLKPVTYYYKKDETKHQEVGFIAQDVKKVIPEVVTGSEGDLEKGETLGLSYGNLVPVLTKAIQEQQAMIEELKKKVEILEAKTNK